MADRRRGLDRRGTCPCGSGAAYDACCGPVVRNERAAATAEELMRSRYAAYVVADVDHLFRSWHPRTRPADLTPEPGVRWVGLEVLGTEAGGPEDQKGIVTFRAHWVRHDARPESGTLEERSRFARRAGRWVYVDGDVTGG